MSSQAQELFISSVEDSDTLLTDLGFCHNSTIRKGYATFIAYNKNDTLITFILGPSDWHVEIILLTKNKKYEFKDLLGIPSISQWTTINKFEPTTKETIKDEVVWFMKFIRFVLTEI